MNDRKPLLLLLILDGWGYRDAEDFNAIHQAHTPQWDQWWQNHPHMLLEASGEAVGLPHGQMGNSEVGHMHIGAGRIIHQDYTRINDAVHSDELSQHPLLIQLKKDCNHKEQTIHLAGLFSNGGVHSHEAHLFALIETLAPQFAGSIALHCFLDGRDTAPQSARNSFTRLQPLLNRYPNVFVATISGRYFAMDRDNRWERTKKAYHCIATGQTESHFATPEEALSHNYAQNITDEFIPPCVINDYQGIQANDAFLFFNFRADRARQLSQAFTDTHFSEFSCQTPALSHFVTMTQYSEDIHSEVLFPPQDIRDTLGQVVSDAGMKQLRIAETEKYAHVTFFLNGGRENPFDGEERILIPSPKVATYDLQPEMSAEALTDALVEAINKGPFDLIVANYANADMVGHTGQFDASVRAIEALDACFARLQQAIKTNNTQLLITADHGNAEQMFNPDTQQAHTAHTTLPVPFLYIGEGWDFKAAHGELVDIAPTALTLLDLPVPSSMVGKVQMVRA